jgi:Uma2 family endonuclease
MVRDGQKADLINGVIYMASPDNTDAAELYSWLFNLMGFYVSKRRLGKIYGSRVAFRLTDNYAPEPDIAIVLNKNLNRVHRGEVDGGPDLAVEIVSPDSVDRDFDLKRQAYQNAGVPEYWIIDEMEQQTFFLRLDKNGVYQEVRLRKGVFSSQVLKGFWLRPDWLWQDPLPELEEVYREIIGPVM